MARQQLEDRVGEAVACKPGWAGWQLANQMVPHLYVVKPGGKTGERQTVQPRVPAWKRKPQNHCL